MAMMNQRGQMVGPPGGVGAGAAGGLQPGMMPAGAGATMGPRPGMQYMAGPSPGGAGGMMPQGSPMGMQQQQQGGPSPAGGQFIHSPQSVPSPASVPMRPMPSSMQAPSPAGSMPTSAANTPMNPDQQPGSVEDQQGCNFVVLFKWTELAKTFYVRSQVVVCTTCKNERKRH